MKVAKSFLETLLSEVAFYLVIYLLLKVNLQPAKMNESKDSLSSFIESEDVSEHAELIGLQFDQVIKECHLGDQLNPLMKHVIYLLEQMDLMIKEKNELQNSLGAVEGQLQQFQFESRESKLERIKCQSEFEQIEESFRNENTELLNLISKLKEDNLKLRNLRNKETFEDDGKFYGPFLNLNSMKLISILFQTNFLKTRLSCDCPVSLARKTIQAKHRWRRELHPRSADQREEEAEKSAERVRSEERKLRPGKLMLFCRVIEIHSPVFCWISNGDSPLIQLG